jgi:hypothetical protein
MCFFLQCINGIDKKYPVLFGGGVEREDEEPGSEGIERTFGKYYGWVYSATIVADHERISLDAAFELPIYQFLNGLAYMKMKRKVEESQMEQLRRKK